MKKLLVTLLFFVFLNEAHSSHIMGGELGWECVRSGKDEGKFIFQMTLYYLCPHNLPISHQIVNPYYSNFGGPAFYTVSRESSFSLAPVCYSSGYIANCNRGDEIEEWNFKSQPLQLNGPLVNKGGDFYWTSCCRPASSIMRNINGSGFYLRATIYPYVIDSAAAKVVSLGTDSTDAFCFDDSPKFAASPQYFVCAGYSRNFDVSAYDIDGDSLVYKWANPMTSSTIPGSWFPRYSITSQFPGPLVDSNNQLATLNTTNGLITSKAYLPLGGYHAYCVAVDAYKNKRKVSTTYRDMVFIQMDCDTIGNSKSLNNKVPTIEFKEKSALSYSTSYHDTIAVGDSIELDIKSTDVGFLPIGSLVFQSVDLQLFGVSVPNSLNNQSNCNLPPCAKIQALGNTRLDITNNRFIDTISARVRFKWKTNCEMLNSLTDIPGKPKSRTYHFTVRTKDNWCPVPISEVKIFTITVIDSASLFWPITKLDASKGGALIQWDNAHGASGFNHYELKRSSNVGAWTSVKISSNPSDSIYYDTAATTDSKSISYHLNVNGSLDCNPGHMVKSIHLQVKRRGKMVKLNWNPPYENFKLYPCGKYKIYRMDSLGNDVLLDSMNFYLQNKWEYNDVIPHPNKWTRYRVESQDEYGLHAISNVDSVRYILPPAFPNYATGSGTVDTSKVGVGVTTWAHEEWKIFPNPFNQYVIIEAHDLSETSELKVFDVQGQLSYAGILNKGENRIDTRNFPSGIYYFSYADQNGKAQVKRLVKYKP